MNPSNPKKALSKKAASPKIKLPKKPVKKAEPKARTSYDAFKKFEGHQYTGMKVGRSHSWHYDKGDWKERKITPDKWEITYAVTKRRAGHAPEGTGVPVGTGYHWFILSHQFVHKLNANDYSTAMVGLKLKLAHKRFDKETWNISESAKVKNLIRMLEDFISELKADPAKFETIALEFEFQDKLYIGYAVPMPEQCQDGICNEYDIILNDRNLGVIRCKKDGWRMNNVKPQAFVNAIGNAIRAQK
jgi:hypothetical protein